MDNASIEQNDFFSLLGLEKEFDLDSQILDEVYFSSQRRVHPDTITHNSEMSAAINTAYKTLKDPTARCEYLLNLLGYTTSNNFDASDIFAMQEELLDAENKTDILKRLQAAITTEQESLRNYSVTTLNPAIANEIFQKIFRIKLMKKILERY